MLTGLVGGVALCVVLKYFRDRKRLQLLRAAASGGRLVRLTNGEARSTDLASQATTTFYQGKCPEEEVRERVAQVVCANPWLAGRLKTDPDTGRVALWIPDAVDSRSVLRAVRVAEEELMGNYSPEYFVKKGSKLLDLNEPVAKFTCFVAPSRWCLTISMSHMIADGHTFYCIYGMLDQDVKAWPMVVDRLKSFDPLTCLNTAPRHGKWSYYVQYVLLGKLGLRKKPMIVSRGVRYVREEWLEEQRRAHEPSVDAEFLSTNDILTSWILRACNPSAGAMTVNMRNRIHGLGDEHAGHYSTLLIYYPEEFSDPANIRRSVTRLCQACTVDGLKQKRGSNGKFGMVLVWHMLYKHVRFSGCEQLSHFPCSALPVNWDTIPVPLAAIFRPSPGRLAISFASDQELPEGPLGDPVWGSEAMTDQWPG